MRRKIITLFLLCALVCSLSVPVYANMPNLAVSAGYNFGGGVDTRQDAIDASNTYSSIGYNTVTLTNAVVSDFSGSNRLAAIMFFSGHGNNDLINIGNAKIECQSGSPSDSTCVNLWNTVANQNLIVFAGCQTAAPAPYTLSSVTKRAFNQGAAASVGWITDVVASSHSNWLQRFNNALSVGLNVIQAKNVANSYAYLPGSGVKNVSVFCDEDVYITTPASNTAYFDSNPDCIAMLENTQNRELLKKLVIKSNKEFEYEDELLKCYTYPDLYDGSRLVDVYFKIDGVISNASIVMLLDSNDNITAIWKYNIDTVDLQEFLFRIKELSVMKSTVDNKIQANKRAIMRLNEGEQIVKQEQFDYYDVVENKSNLVTYTTIVDRFGAYYVIDDIMSL